MRIAKLYEPKRLRIAWVGALSKTLLFFAWLCVPVVVLASAAERSNLPIPAKDVLSLTVRLLDGDRNPLPDTSYAGDVTLLFPFIAGALFGEADTAQAIRKRVRVGDLLRFDLASLLGLVDAAARSWRDTEQNRSLIIRPREARILRFGTASARDDGEAFADQTFTVDLATKDTLLLVYVDRPCTIRGTGRTGVGTAEHAIDFPAAGFHWVRARQIQTGQSRLTYESAVQNPTIGLQVFGREQK